MGGEAQGSGGVGWCPRPSVCGSDISRVVEDAAWPWVFPSELLGNRGHHPVMEEAAKMREDTLYDLIAMEHRMRSIA